MVRAGTVDEGFCATGRAFLASEGFLPVSRVTSPFKAATTAGKRVTNSIDLSEDHVQQAASPEHIGVRTVALPRSG